MPPSRLGFFALSVALLGACHEPSGSSSIAPVQRASAQSPSADSSQPAVDRSGDGAGSKLTGSASEGVASAGPVGSAPARLADAGSSEHSSPASADSNIILTGDAAAQSAPVSESAPIPLLDAQGKPLPQTDQRPSASTPAFRRRIEAVAAAIISGDAEPALSSFFPLVAYAQVKDVAKPERDYKFRLLANFKRDVLEYHRALGASAGEAAQAKFSGITVSEKDAKWMAPGSEGNKLGYFRVLRSRLHFTLPAGRSRDFELTSLISWRGEWYVVHLHGFK